MELNTQRKFVVIEPITAYEGQIPNGSEIILFRKMVYLNGGMVHPAYQKMLLNIVNDPNLRNKHLREVKIIQNKI